MDYQNFLNYFKSIKHTPKNGYIEGGLISDTYFNIPWEIKYKYSEELIGEDFGCNFINNRCIMERTFPLNEWWKGLGKDSKHVSYCCSTCYISVGNIRRLPSDLITLKLIASLFDYVGRRGFWREDIGCILPHKFRSTLCLTDRCDYLKEILAPRKELIQKIDNLLNLKSLWEMR